MHKDILAQLQKWDRTIVLANHSIQNPVLTWVMRAISYSGSAPTWIVVTTWCTYLKLTTQPLSSTDTFIVSIFPAMIALGIGNFIMRPLFKRPRPYMSLKNVDALVWVPKNYSMPSTHAATSIALFTSLWLLGHPLTIGIGIWALFVTYSRLYLGVHYLTDLLAGVALGIVIAAGFHLFI